MLPVCDEKYFKDYLICNVTDESENYTCFGCQHYSYKEGINLFNSIFGKMIQQQVVHTLQIVVVSFSQLVGLGAEMQKTSILMGLLHYNEYEATNITYYISISSSSLYLIFLCLFCGNEIGLVDDQAIQLFFPFIVILTDIGNYLNRTIYDQVFVLITISLEYIWIILLTLKYDRSRNHEIESKKKEITIDEHLINYKLKTQSSTSLLQQLNNKENSKYSLLWIVLSQLLLQSTLFFLRGGNPIQFIKFKYSGLLYWIITGVIYTFGFLISYYLYIRQAKDYKKHMNDDPNFYEIRPLNQSLLLILIGLVSFFFSGISGVGAGLILIPSCILIKRFRMGILKAIRTMVVVQFLIDICVIPQTIQNYNSLEIDDQLFYMLIGIISFILTILFHKFLIKESYQLNLILIIIGLFAFDFIIGIYQAYTFESPIKRNPYFSISIDDCSINCKFKLKK
ncbi:unnamed protein product [Paramecium sonneborni]|uniref:Uncharacterized protein n=1 Tax=Paramecium sonneborni TaxID=65129 RepID=A0A8S1MH22_9CILI|nr:unnamed protein product [Paramecium sonneborni]